MVGHEVAAAALARIRPGSEGEATVTERDLALTRFAASRIHQNLAERDATLRSHPGPACGGFRECVHETRGEALLASPDRDPAIAHPREPALASKPHGA